MPDMHSLSERLFYTNRRTYSVKKGDVAYLDGTPLSRPMSMPVGQKAIMLVFVAVALVIGLFVVNSTVLDTMRQAERAEQAIGENLQRQASIETIPNMAKLVNKSDKKIRAAFEKAGYELYDASSLSESESTILFKLPSDVNADDAAAMYAQGIGTLTAEQATKLLVGGWRFESDRVNGTTMAVHYADFSTVDPAVAVQSAIAAEGFDPESVTETGVDDSGNTYSMGTLDADGTNCTWKVSALPLGEIYSIAGMPENACYVGVRITAQ